MSNERTGVLELTLGDSYIGSAYSPQVEVTDTPTGHEVAITYMSPEGIVTERFDVADGATGPQGPAGYSPTVTITDTPTGHTVTITDEDGPHSYDVPNYAQEEQERQDAWDTLSGEVVDAITAAETATSAASTAATSATSAASSATSAAQAANTAAASANTAASSANAAATAANAAASDASAAATGANAAASAASSAADDASDAADEARQIAEDIQEELDAKADTHGQYPSLSVGRADALTGADETAQWATRVTTGSGAATVRSIKGRTLGWNQHVNDANASWSTLNGAKSYSDGVVTVTPNGGDGFTFCQLIQNMDISGIGGHKYFVSTDFLKEDWSDTALASNYAFPTLFGSWLDQYVSLVPSKSVTTWQHLSGIVSQASDNPSKSFTFRSYGDTYPFSIKNVMVIDLTQMFGAGNEPATVAEFEAMYPEAYYPYSAPMLKPVQIAGISSVGFNQWDTDTGGAQYLGHYYIEGETYNYAKRENSNYDCYRVPVFPSTEYCISADSGTLGSIVNKRYVDASGNFISGDVVGWNALYGVFTTPSAARYIEVSVPVGTTKKLCVNISNPALNGTYKPYTTDSIEWTAQTLRAAGSVRDELTAGELVTRVGVVDLGELSWSRFTSDENQTVYYAAVSEMMQSTSNRIECGIYATDVAYINSSGAARNMPDKSISSSTGASKPYIYIKDSAYSDAGSLEAALSGVSAFYPLATPTITPISPALPMSYKVEQGGTESIIVPDGEVSAAPVLTVAEGESAAEVVMAALACIAAPDGPVAASSHATGTYLTMQGKLYKVTSAIAVGETIAAGTNVTQTTVMAELIARTA